jgi:hypothetical protein
VLNIKISLLKFSKVLVERGLSWEKAFEIHKKQNHIVLHNLSEKLNQNDDDYLDDENSPYGFYISNQSKNNHRISILATIPDDLNKTNKNLASGSGGAGSTPNLKCSNVVAIYRPNICLQNKLESVDCIKKKYKKVKPSEARKHWIEHYEKSAVECTHLYRQGHCTNSRNCEIGLRTRKYHILAGSVLTVWSKVEGLLSQLLTNSNQYRLQIIRVRTNDNQKIVGCVIPNSCLKQIDNLLNSMSSDTHVQQYSSNKNNLTMIEEEPPVILLDDDDNDDENQDVKEVKQPEIEMEPEKKEVVVNIINEKSDLNDDKTFDAFSNDEMFLDFDFIK